MTPKDLKNRYPGYQVKSSKSTSNGYHLLVALKAIRPQAKIVIWDDVHIYINDEYQGHWDHMVKPGQPKFSVWNQGEKKFTLVNLSLKVNEKDFKKGEGNVASRVNSGDWIEVPVQYDFNDYTVYFLNDYMYEFAKNFTKRSYKWRGMYDMCVKGFYPIAYDSCAQYCTFSKQMSWGAKEVGLYHYKKGELLPQIPASFGRGGGKLHISFRGLGRRMNSTKISIDDKEVKAGNIDISSIGRKIIRIIFGV